MYGSIPPGENQIIYNYYKQPDKTLDIYIVKLLSCIS